MTEEQKKKLAQENEKIMPPKDFFKEARELKIKMRELLKKYGVTKGFELVVLEGIVYEKYDVGVIDCSNQEVIQIKSEPLIS